MESQLKVLDENDLLDALTQHYYRYRMAVKLGGSVDEFNRSRDTLLQILNELNSRRLHHFKDADGPRKSQSDNIFENGRRSEEWFIFDAVEQTGRLPGLLASLQYQLKDTKYQF